MLSRKLHIEQINRFYDKLDELSSEIVNCSDADEMKDRRMLLCLQYFHLSTSTQGILDDATERVKDILDEVDFAGRKIT